MIEIKSEKLDIKRYHSLRDSVGWKHLTDRQAEMAINNCMYMATAYDGDKLIGMGRVVGDGAVICYIQDLVLIPEYHGKGAGSILLKHLIDYVKGLSKEDETMMLCLMCAKGREKFYIKNGFTARPTENLGPGMIMYL